MFGAAPLMTGGVSSTLLTLKLQAAVLPDASVAEGNVSFRRLKIKHLRKFL
jgi:hypothetical protein